MLLGDPDEGAVPEAFGATGARALPVALKAIAKGIPGSWTNMVALGLAGTLVGLPLRSAGSGAARIVEARRGQARGKPAGARSRRRRCRGDRRRAPPAAPRGTAFGRWMISGNEAAGYGAIRGGVRFVAAYPITPATEMLEWMAPALAKVGGTLLQAEDELASVNMIIGASYGGIPALTATAGPGLALMTEALGLACCAEVPIVVVDVMRGGPSTGIPAKSEQSDLAYAVGGLPGDAPRLVLAPNSIADCVATTQWAVLLAETLQAPAIVLSDQFMGQSRAIVDRPDEPGFVGARLTAVPGTTDYKRYRDTPSGSLADGRSRHAGAGLYGRRPRAFRGRHSQQPGSRSSAPARQARAQAGAARLWPLVGRHRRRRRARGAHLRLDHRLRCARRSPGCPRTASRCG